jgi:ABC-type multidrug transport system fused ATPase/permease subunit
MYVRFEGVGVTYAGRSPVLKDINLDIPPAARVALIGPSGAGKSTIASLILRRSDPSCGRITINGIPLPSYNLSSVLAHVGVILQRSEIVSGTVRENILLSVPPLMLPSISDDQVWRVMDLVSPHMRDRFCVYGLDTRVGKQGLQLSGGEQQRLCVMRALIKNPELLIVDEATSSLDSVTEEAVQQGIDVTLSKGISALVIAHRFSTLKKCNRFVVLKTAQECGPLESQIEAESDSLPDLYAISATFRTLADKQGFRVE